MVAPLPYLYVSAKPTISHVPSRLRTLRRRICARTNPVYMRALRPPADRLLCARRSRCHERCVERKAPLGLAVPRTPAGAGRAGHPPRGGHPALPLEKHRQGDRRF
ncbi:hypothetical protein ASZ90_011017 [hydrocarbon metagenome]|uniref:Uncharacterized protein n=1 Tax=hydrocarbon metagenome TaxID=938273 RepID=A0A0W8FEE1_9ZZZZ